MAIKHVIKVTSQQWEDLKTTGQTIDADGNIHRYDGSGETVYNVYDYDEIIELNNKIDTILAGATPSTTQLVHKTISDMRTDIITANPSLANKFCLGFKALLSQNNTIYKNGYTLYVNGVERNTDYTYPGENQEYVTVLYFADANDELVLTEQPDFIIFETYIYGLGGNINFNENYYKNSDKLVSHGYPLKVMAGNRFVEFYGISQAVSYPLESNWNSIETFYSEATTISNSAFSIGAHPYFKRIDLPELLEIIYTNGDGAFKGLGSTIINFPKLETVTGVGNVNYVSFREIDNLTLPESLRTVTSIICVGVKNITLNCKYVDMSDDWYSSYNHPSLPFPTTVTVCDDWQASINLVYACKKQGVDWFEDLFENKLATLQTTKQIKIPTAIYNTLNTTQCTVAGYTDLTWIQYVTQIKNWTVAFA